MRSTETDKSLAWRITFEPVRPGYLSQSIERMMVPLRSGILPRILNASSGLRLQIQAAPAITYPLHQSAPTRTRAR